MIQRWGLRCDTRDDVAFALISPAEYATVATSRYLDGTLISDAHIESTTSQDSTDTLFGLLMTAPIREPDQIRQDAARKLRSVSVSEHFQAVLGCLLDEDWTTPRLVEMVITPDGHLLGRCQGQSSFSAFLGASKDLLKNIHGIAPVAELDGDEIGYLLGKVAEIKGPRIA